MLHYITPDGGKVSIDPRCVSSVRQDHRAAPYKSLLSGNVQSITVAVIRMADGLEFDVEGDSVLIARQIEEARQRGTN